jgi:NADPH-dependent 2,4-dienoyl-CoA reductase/sulfur reductase-like enzyme
MTGAAPVLVVGAGPAGAGVALALAEAGVATVLVDDNAAAGGQAWRGGPPLGAIGIDRRGPALRKALAASDLVDHRAGCELVDLGPGAAIVVGPDGRLEPIAHRALVLATGAVESFVPVPGWTLEGVVGVGGLQAMIKSSGLLPPGRIVVAGAGPLLYLLAAQLCSLGSPPAAVVDAAGRPSLGALAAMAAAPRLLALGLACRTLLARHGVRLLRRTAVAAVQGATRVGAVDLLPLDTHWRPRGAAVRIAADILALGFGVRPNPEAGQLAGCALAFDEASRSWGIARDGHGATSVPGVFACGDATGIAGADAADTEAPAVAAAVLAHLGLPVPDALAARVRAGQARLRRLARFRRGLAAWSGLRPGIFSLASPDTIVCRCEGTTAGRLREAAARGHPPAAARLLTRAGMGLCQGRTCTLAVRHLLTGGGPDSPHPTARPPLRPVGARALMGILDLG